MVLKYNLDGNASYPSTITFKKIKRLHHKWQKVEYVPQLSAIFFCIFKK